MPYTPLTGQVLMVDHLRPGSTGVFQQTGKYRANIIKRMNTMAMMGSSHPIEHRVASSRSTISVVPDHIIKCNRVADPEREIVEYVRYVQRRNDYCDGTDPSRKETAGRADDASSTAAAPPFSC